MPFVKTLTKTFTIAAFGLPSFVYGFKKKHELLLSKQTSTKHIV